MTQQYPTPPAAEDAPSNEDGNTNIAEIEAEIDQTRHAISGDLRTLGERLDPAHLKSEAKEVIVEAKNAAVDTLHEAKNMAKNTVREVKDSAVHRVTDKVDAIRRDVRVAERETVGFVRDNAVPLALIGAGVAWFVANRRSHDRRWEGEYGQYAQGDRDWRYPSERGLGGAREQASHLAGSAREAAYRAKSRTGRWVDDANHRVGSAAGRVRGFAERESEQARGAARDAGQRLSSAANRARDVAGHELRHARDYSRQVTEAHPLAVGAAAVAAGIGIGLLIPATRPEQRILGTRRDDLIDNAKETAQQIAHTAKQTARDVKDSLTGNLG